MAGFDIRRLSIRSRMHIMLLLFVLFFFILGFHSYYFINELKESDESLYTHSFLVSNAVNQTNFYLSQMELELHNLNAEENSDKRKILESEIEKNEGEISRLLELISNSYLGSKDEIESLEKNYEVIKEKISELLRQIQSDVSTDVSHSKILRLDTDIKSLRQDLNNINKSALREASQFNKASRRILAKFRNSFLAILALSLLFIILAAVVIIKSIVNPVQKLIAQSESVNSGKAVISAPPQIRDEMDELTAAFSVMTNNMVEANKNLEEKVVERAKVLEKEIQEHNIAKEKQEVSDKLFTHMFESSLFGIAFWNAEGDLTSVNDAFLKIIGFTRKEFTEHKLNFRDITEESSIKKEEELAADFDGSIKPFRKVYRHKDGHRVYVLIGASQARENPFLGISFVIDISEQVKNEKELKKYQDNLEGIIKERTSKLEQNIAMVDESRRALTFLLEDVNDSRTELENLNTQLDSVNQELEAFSYSVSHDLKAPLRAIDGFSLALKEDYDDKLDESGKEFIELIRNNARRMGQLINDLLAFSRLGRKAIKYSSIDLRKMSTEIFEDITKTIENREIELKYAGNCQMYADEKMIRQVLINLISNAVKFSATRAQAVIEIGCRKREKDIEVYVKDNGVGFDMKYIDKLFGVFQRLHSDDEFEGTGVGLALSRRIINKHQGSIKAEAEIDKGAVFTFSLPLPESLETSEKE